MQRSLPCSRSLAVICLFGLAGCDDYDDDDDFVVFPNQLASDFQSLSDYLASPAVQNLLKGVPRFVGSTPPNVGGSYSSSGFITSTSIPGSFRGDPVSSSFCFGIPVAGSLEVVVQDPSVVDAGANSVIEGNGDRFTVYTAFKSTQSSSGGGACEIHEVNVFSGRRLPSGSFDDLIIGVAIVGLIGDCFPFLPGDFQRSDNTALLVGGPCSSVPVGPANPSNVLVVVDNNLVTDLLVFLGTNPQPTVEVPPLSTRFFETAPGFQLGFESLQPSAGTDGMGNELLMGEIVAGDFPLDVTKAGGTVPYSIENQVGSDEFFAPLPLNLTNLDVYTKTNLGVNVPGYPPPPGSGLDCQCIMGPSGDPYVIGYYSYSRPGVITANQANVQFFNLANDLPIGPPYVGPFQLEQLTGGVVLQVPQ
jgi:hypothetical protein